MVPELDISTTEIICHIETANEPTPSCSGQNQLSPSKIRPLPKTPPRKTNMNSSRKRKFALLPDTPEKEALSDWVECTVCKLWGHVGCFTGDTITFVCKNCDSEED